MIKLGNLKLKNRIFLAPMAGINDIAFRILCRKAGSGLVYTGMINPLTEQKLELWDKPAIQLFSRSEKGIYEFIKKHDKDASLWDFNLGCPAPNAKNQGVGSYLSDLKVIEKTLKIIRKSTKKPVTIKIRISENNYKILKLAEKYCDAICIHPRTSKQMYSGNPDLKYALDLKKKTKLPVIYSGNVNEKNCSDLLQKFDFVMIGRNAIGNPGVFSKLTGKKIKLEFKDYLKLAKKYKLYFSQIKLQAMNFTKNQKDAKEMRRKLILAKNIEDIRKVYSII